MDGLASHPAIDAKESLRSVLFGLPEEDLDELARVAVVRALPSGEVVCLEGSPGDAFYVIVSGRMEMLQRLDDDSERVLHLAGPGEFFGEMAIVHEGVRTATVRTVEPSSVLEIGREAFLRVLGRSPALAVRIVVYLTSRLRDADQQAILELRRANEELRRTLHCLQRLDRTKTDFIRVSAHELRTPVAALLGYAQMMQDSPLARSDGELRTLVKGVVASTERLHRVFNSILDLSRVVDGDAEIHRSPVSVSVTLQSIEAEFSDVMEERGLTVDLKGLRDLPFVQADPDLTYRALRHLFGNAVKYTPDGGRITVTGHVVDVDEMGRCVEVSVQDSGIGIAPEDIDLIFEKFYRTGEVALYSSGTTSFKGGGPGLGLAIVRGVVLAHGGRIWAESPGYDEEACPGSRFVVQLPLEGPGVSPLGEDR